MAILGNTFVPSPKSEEESDAKAADEIYFSSDYGGAGKFYFGYEAVKCFECGSEGYQACECDGDEDWCFTVTEGDKVTYTPSRDLGPDRFDIAENLIAGLLQHIRKIEAQLANSNPPPAESRANQ